MATIMGRTRWLCHINFQEIFFFSEEYKFLKKITAQNMFLGKAFCYKEFQCYVKNLNSL